MPTSAPGSRPLRRRAAAPDGFTLIELLLVLAIVAMASAGVGFALRDVGQTQLEREAQRLVAMLESARARSRASGMPVYWRATELGFEFIGLPAPATTDGDGDYAPGNRDFAPVMAWQSQGLSVRGSAFLTLGPEPIIARQEIVLQQGDRDVRIGTDGLRAFALLSAQAPGAVP